MKKHPIYIASMILALILFVIGTYQNNRYFHATNDILSNYEEIVLISEKEIRGEAKDWEKEYKSNLKARNNELNQKRNSSTWLNLLAILALIVYSLGDKYQKRYDKRQGT